MKRLAIALCLAAMPMNAAAERMSVSLDSGWQVRIDPADTKAAAEHRGAARWIPATVPGVVQRDLIARRIVPDPFTGTNEAAIQWAGLTGWEYRRTIDVSAEMLAHDRVDLVFDGLDTFATVFLNGTQLLSADNAHRRWRVDAKAALRPGANELLIRFRSPIRELQPRVLAEKNSLPGEYDSAFGDEPKGVQTSPYIRKPKYQYGWDWAPRIVAQGPWQPVRLELWDQARIDTLAIDQEAITPTEARIVARADIDAVRSGMVELAVDVTGPDGGHFQATRKISVIPGRNHILVPIPIARPQLWQPAGYGAQPLYRISADLSSNGKALDHAARATGLRTVELIRDGGAFGFKINGTTVFAKGANLIPFDSLPTRATEAQMRQILESARDANMNMVRVWGGGYYLPDSFYDLADQLGIMVWQDFMFGGAVPPPDPEYRASVSVEAEQQVDRLSNHPSIVLWNGNNEVQSGWANWGDRTEFKRKVGADEQERIATAMTDLFDRVLRQAAVRDSDVPYWPGSPSTDYQGPEGPTNGDLHFWDVWSGSKPVENYLDQCPRFVSEYGFQSMPIMATVAAFGAKKLDPEDPAMRAHQKFLSGDGNQRLEFYRKARLRPARDFADFDYLTQVNQMQAIRLAASHHRACRPVTLGTLYWQLNDTWPAISWASIDWFGRKKLLHYDARRFFAPQAIVAERTDANRISLVSDAVVPIAARWRLRAITMDGRSVPVRDETVTLAPLSATKVAALSDDELFGAMPPADSYAVAELLIGDRVVSRSLIERLAPKDMHYPDPAIRVRWTGKQVTLTATNLARAVMLDFGTVDARPSDGGFDLLPGESRTIEVPAARLAKALTIRTLAAPK